jgi:hypothetical protein
MFKQKHCGKNLLVKNGVNLSENENLVSFVDIILILKQESLIT